jgi:hypothetical protein
MDMPRKIKANRSKNAVSIVNIKYVVLIWYFNDKSVNVPWNILWVFEKQ